MTGGGTRIHADPARSEAEGFKAISRWSAKRHHRKSRRKKPSRQGWQPPVCEPNPRLAPRRGACPGWPQTGGVADPQPPANGCDASGVKQRTVLASSSGWPLGQARYRQTENLLPPHKLKISRNPNLLILHLVASPTTDGGGLSLTI